jgi:hypothetical protein
MNGLKRMVVLGAVGALALVGCGPATWYLTNGPQTAGAQGKVTAVAGPNNNTRLAIQVKHLAPPGKVQPTATVYVVWVRGIEASDLPQNVGALTLDHQLTGALETTTALRTFDLLITAEASRTADQPTSDSVLSGRIARR